ncbi:hypothetical protein IAQ61_006696 [Plenodomus lingam]|uniref:uncharacterized protein n=1 Tax=Leptosphaeria maculans TaxID=5022 RepID=UPI0033307812|nr:hypothetical protein IAQ61_006696 [Plenodomus lingam]
MSYNNETASPASGNNSAQGKDRAITDVATGALAARLPASSHKKFDDDMSMGSCGEQDRSHAISMLTPCPNRGAVPGFDESAEVSSPSAANVFILRLHAFLGIGSPTSISIDAERVAPGANPSRPGFLKGVVFKSSNKDEWLTIALPHIATLTFTIASIANLIFAGPLFSSPELPNLYYGITKFAFPGFHWFSGVTENRARNPFLNMAANLPHIEDIALSMHTTGITMSCWTEQQQVEIERVDAARSQERKIMMLSDVITKYDFEAILRCTALEKRLH